MELRAPHLLRTSEQISVEPTTSKLSQDTLRSQSQKTESTKGCLGCVTWPRTFAFILALVLILAVAIVIPIVVTNTLATSDTAASASATITTNSKSNYLFFVHINLSIFLKISSFYNNNYNQYVNFISNQIA